MTSLDTTRPQHEGDPNYNVDVAHTDSIAIAGSLFIIVLSSTVIGTLLPLGMYFVGLDPAHAGPSIQVIMDVMGVAITCMVCKTMLLPDENVASD
jgi:Mg/Co/Ni transporter MgtE